MWKDCGVAMTNHTETPIHISYGLIGTMLILHTLEQAQNRSRSIGETTRPDDRRRTPVIGPSTHPAAASHSASIRAG